MSKLRSAWPHSMGRWHRIELRTEQLRRIEQRRMALKRMALKTTLLPSSR